MKRNKKIGWLSTVGGAVASILGILGIVCATPVCGVICASGIVAILSGVGVMAFLHRYHFVFLLVGPCILLLGIILIIRCRKKCSCPHEED